MFQGQQAMGGRTFRPGMPTTTGDFNVSLLVLTAAIMKADGTVKKSELEYVKKFYVANFGVEGAKHYIKLLGDILKKDFDVREVSQQIGRFMDYSARLQLMHYLFGIALADGNADESEVEMIERIAMAMGLGATDFQSIKAMFVKDTESAYKILGITANATDEELKTAYREMAKKYHPDKVSHLGEDVKKAAEEKFLKVNEAYETIKKERGMK
jgi:DnaJ like chaperone protein